MKQDTNIVEPKVLFLQDLLKLIEKGDLKIPKFQRPFVWKPIDVLNLFDSIRNGYPIGSLFFWETKENFKSLDKFGLHSQVTSNSSDRMYVLDGQQRLVALFNVLRYNSKITDENWIFSVFYDLIEKEFIHVYKNQKLPHFFPLTAIEKTSDFLKECKTISERKEIKNSDALIEEAENLATSIRDYKISVTKFIGGNLEQAVEIFSRLNKQGRKITTLELFEALTYKEGKNEFDLSKHTDEIINTLAEYNFQTIPRNTILKIILASLDKGYNYRSWYKAAKAYQEEIANNIESIKETIYDTARFFKDRLNVPSFDFVPYVMQFVFLCEFFRINSNPSNKHKDMIKEWFWRTTYTGWFTINRNAYNSHLNEIRNFAKDINELPSVFNENEPALPFPKSYRFQVARVKAFLIFYKSLNPRDLKTGKRLDIDDIFVKYGENCISMLSNNDKTLANTILTDPHSVKSLRSYFEIMIKSNAVKTQEILDTHCLNIKIIKDIISGRKDEFLKARERLLMEKEIEFMKLFNIKPPEINSSKEYLPEYDADDDE